MDPSALIAAATTLLALFSATQVSAQHGLCPPEPVVVHLSRGQKVTVRYWVGEELQQEVTEVPKLTRRPPRPTTTTTTPTTPTTSYDELHGRLGEHNTTATLPDEEEASTATSTTVDQTTPEVANLTISEYAHRDEGNVTEQEESVTEATHSESTVKSTVSEENDQHSTSPENEASTTQITTEEVTTSSTAGSSATSDIRDDSETTVTTIEPTSSTSHLKHEVEYAADTEPVETGHTESQTTTSPVAEETTYTETTTTPTTQQSEINTSEDHVTEGLLYRSPNNDSQSITLNLDDSVNLENLTEASILQTNETSGTEEQQPTTVSSASDSTSTDDVSTTTTDLDQTTVLSSDADVAAKVATAFTDATTSEAVEQTETTQTEVQEGNISERTTEEGISSPTESTASEGTPIYPTTLSYREGPDDDSLVIVDDENNKTTSEKSSITVISSNNTTNEFSLEQSFSVDTLNESDINNASGNVSLYVQDSNDTVSDVSAQASITTEFPHTTQTLADELSETSTIAEASTDASLRTSSESVETTTSAAEISVTDQAESAPNVTNYEVTVEQDTVQETASINNVSEPSVEDNSTIHAEEATTTSGSDDILDEFALDSTMPPLVAADESLVESILHQVLVANSTEDDEEAKEGRQLDKDNDVYPSDAEPEQNDEDDGQEEVQVATEEYLSTLVQETPAENNEESPSSTQQPAAKDDEESVDRASDENIPAGPRRGPDPNPDWDSPVSHYAYPESNGAHGPRVYIASRSRRDVSPVKANTTLCQWVFKTDPGIPLLLTFKNFSTPDSERCVLHHIAVERSNGYEARWCGEAYESPSHATFARHEIKLRLYSEHDGGAPSGFIAEIQALDMKLLRKAVPKARPLLHHPHHPHH